jgi:hypothetical protein
MFIGLNTLYGVEVDPIDQGNGAYVHKLSKKCVQVKKLTSVAAVSTKENAVRRMLEEVFQCEKETQIAYVG